MVSEMQVAYPIAFAFGRTANAPQSKGRGLSSRPASWQRRDPHESGTKDELSASAARGLALSRGLSSVPASGSRRCLSVTLASIRSWLCSFDMPRLARQSAVRPSGEQRSLISRWDQPVSFRGRPRRHDVPAQRERVATRRRPVPKLGRELIAQLDAEARARAHGGRSRTRELSPEEGGKGRTRRRTLFRFARF